MMNKIFIGLCILTLVGAGVLYWLLKSIPQPSDALTKHSVSEVSGEHAGEGAESEHTAKEGKEAAEGAEHAVAKDEHGAANAEHGEAKAEHGAAKGEHAEASEEHGKDAHAETKEGHGAPAVAKEEHSAESHEEKKEEAAHTEHSTAKVAEAPKASAAKAAQKSARLTVKTNPVPATVYVDGVKKGQTPLEVALTDKPQNLKIEAAGYVTEEELAPSIKEVKDNENLPMVIVLEEKKEKVVAKKVEAPAAHHAAPVAPAPKKALSPVKQVTAPHSPAEVSVAASEDFFRHGPQGPFWIQLKAFSPSESSQVKTFVDTASSKSKDAIIACQVDLKTKGKWTRILVGPFDNKMDAKVSLDTVKRSLAGEAFVTGEQECL